MAPKLTTESGASTSVTDYTVSVDGMVCPACENVIRAELGERSSVTSVDADFETGTVSVTGSEEARGSVEYTLETMGYAVEDGTTKTYDFSVEGMSCTACDNIVRRGLAEYDAVHEVDADWEAGRVTVVADAGHDAGLVAAIEDMGYTVEQ